MFSLQRRTGFPTKKDIWRSLFPLVQAPSPRVLEIGTWEGRSAVFLLTELCKDGGEIVCIDHFDLLGTVAGRERYKAVTHNLQLTKKTFRLMDEFSAPALMQLLSEETMREAPGYDWIYIDGSHEAADTFLDGEMAWRLAKKGAIMCFDDYHWDAQPETSAHHPKPGIDAFLLLHRGEFDSISTASDYQVFIRKKVEMRIGFLLKPASPALPHVPEKSLGYGINLAVAADSKFAMGAAVAIRSATEQTCTAEASIRMSIYVLDCGLTTADKAMISASVPAEEDVTLVFIDLPGDSLTKKSGAVWAKVDMIQLVPVERVLYLDADVVVLRSLEDLWRTDLGGKPLGAARDVGFPKGHAKVKSPYFNAGVLLLDLTAARQKIGELKSLSMKPLPFHDQDALNLHFHGEWTTLAQEWNAQGLGTYADLASADREEIAADVAAMKAEPRIIHFTGPVNPTLAEVLNPFVKFSAKPWGYASAPNHPFCSAWWSVLERTAWKGVRASGAFIESHKAEHEEAINRAIAEFRKVLEKRE
ncbi:glycosyltransferase family 8 protein [Mycena metata]|uniref:Glycosyltransferase family 8 protein n=1 Tax=Mycena metata TaxID=1033252 RepID=A0AAD7P1W0_9AGAR|nr:glycosyltransferase family 8 protein [Mycena metata]